MPEPEAVALLRTRTGAERLAMADALFRSARELLKEHLTRRHADWSDDEICREVARRISHGAV